MKCWQCGAEPLETFEITTLGDPEPRYIPGRWPQGDHTHEVVPPTPEELVDRGHRLFTSILTNWFDT